MSMPCDYDLCDPSKCTDTMCPSYQVWLDEQDQNRTARFSVLEDGISYLREE